MFRCLFWNYCLGCIVLPWSADVHYSIKEYHAIYSSMCSTTDDFFPSNTLLYHCSHSTVSTKCNIPFFVMTFTMRSALGNATMKGGGITCVKLHCFMTWPVLCLSRIQKNIRGAEHVNKSQSALGTRFKNGLPSLLCGRQSNCRNAKWNVLEYKSGA